MPLYPILSIFFLTLSLFLTCLLFCIFVSHLKFFLISGCSLFICPYLLLHPLSCVFIFFLSYLCPYLHLCSLKYFLMSLYPTLSHLSSFPPYFHPSLTSVYPSENPSLSPHSLCLLLSSPLLSQSSSPFLFPPTLPVPPSPLLPVIRGVSASCLSVCLCVCSPCSMASLGLLLLSTALIHTAQVRTTDSTHTRRERVYICVTYVLIHSSPQRCIITVT